MLRLQFSLPFFIVISACSGLGTAKPYIAKSPPEYRTAAASIMGTDVNGSVPANSENPNPRIRLKPTPGKAPMIGAPGVEVLESSNKSGAYIAFTGQVPATQYFRIVGRVDCDDWVYLQLINPEMIRSNPNYYISGHYSGDKAPLKCTGKFHEKFREQTDERLIGSDGVVFDAGSAEFTDVDGWSNGHRKIHMDGWAIKFIDPSPRDIKTRLATKALTAIDVVQLKAVAYWIEENRASEYAEDLKKLLPIAPGQNLLSSWRSVDISVLKALATIESVDAPVDTYLKIMRAGISPMIAPGAMTTVPGANVGDAPFVAANVLACRKQPGSADVLDMVLTQATIRQHKLASAKALIAMGKSDLVRQRLNSGVLGDVSSRVTDILVGRDHLPFSCPYGNKVSEKS
jgi:hypothetical protein